VKFHLIFPTLPRYFFFKLLKLKTEGFKMKCPKCQFENREGIKFCEECGAKLELKCPACQAGIPLGRKFCGECGHKVTALFCDMVPAVLYRSFRDK
jgi:predicted amidophosphoribosyltransferase